MKGKTALRILFGLVCMGAFALGALAYLSHRTGY
jgi:hypothetical protein